MAIHGIRNDLANVLLDELANNLRMFRYLLIDCRPRDKCKTGRFARLRYWHRQLLAPPDVPRTPSAELTLRLYQRYGRSYTCLAPALEAHVVCWVIAKAAFISSVLPFGLRLSCFLIGLLLTLCTIAAIEIISFVGVYISLAISIIFRHTLDQIGSLLDKLDVYREQFQDVYPPPSDFYSMVIATFHIILISVVVLGLVWLLDLTQSYLRALFRARVPDFKVCRVCIDQQRTQYFLPCQHLLCCEACGLRLVSCPLCKKSIKAEMRVQPLTGSRCVVCDVADVCRMLVPCGHVVCCAPCAAVLDDCPVCWEEVTDDKLVYLP